MASEDSRTISAVADQPNRPAASRSSAAGVRGVGTHRQVAQVTAACLMVSAAGIAAGLGGLWAEPWRIALTWLLVVVALCLAPARRSESPVRKRRMGLAAGGLGLLILPVGFLRGELHEVLLVTVAAAWLAAGEPQEGRRLWLRVTRALAVWTLFLLAIRFVPGLWPMLDAAGRRLGRGVSQLVDRPLEIGVTFAGLEWLVLIGLLYLESWRSGSRKLRPALALASGLIVVHLVYLGLLAQTHDLLARLPEVAEPVFDHPYEPPDWRWPVAVGTWLPWKLPLLAILGHVAMWGFAWRWSEGARGPSGSYQTAGVFGSSAPSMRAGGLLAASALALAVAATFCRGPADLDGRLLLANVRGRMDWERPQHDRYGQPAAGMFGMLPRLINSLGGTLQLTEQWSEDELAAADAVLLLHPCTSISPDQRERILGYVRRGGSLLLAAEPYQGFGPVISGHEALLAATAIRVRRDVAASPTGPWQPPGMLWAEHPGAAAWPIQRTGAFDSFGSSLALRWPARPLLVGRWGWSNPGSDAARTGVRRFEPGERLGDLVLAAEQRYGRGRIVVLGNSFSLTNEGGVRGYGLSGRLLQYLTAPPRGPQTAPRQLLTLALLVATGVLLVRHPAPEHLGAMAMVLALALPAGQQFRRHQTRVVPDGNLLTAEPLSRLVYLDAAHSPAFSDGQWSPDGINGLALTLMRSDLMPLAMPRVTGERLAGAGMFVAIAPSRGYSGAVQRKLQEFVQRGGVLICMVGAEEAAASAPLLARFGFRVPRSPVPTGGDWKEPEPLGHMRSMYMDVHPVEGEPYQVGLVLYAGWPVQMLRDDGEVLAYGADERPVAVMRQVGRGRVVVIGDSHFALNKNLESSGGEPLDGAYENAHFWRWLLSRLLEQDEWIPPPPGYQAPDFAAGEEGP